MTQKINFGNMKLVNRYYIVEIIGKTRDDKDIESRPIAFFSFKKDADDEARLMYRRDKGNYKVKEKTA